MFLEFGGGVGTWKSFSHGMRRHDRGAHVVIQKEAFYGEDFSFGEELHMLWGPFLKSFLVGFS